MPARLLGLDLGVSPSFFVLGGPSKVERYKISLTWGKSDKAMYLQKHLGLVATEIAETPEPTRTA